VDGQTDVVGDAFSKTCIGPQFVRGRALYRRHAHTVMLFTTHKGFNFYYVEIKCQLDATEVFIADLIACSTCFGHHYAHHQELKSIIQWLLPVVFRAVFTSGASSIISSPSYDSVIFQDHYQHASVLVVVPETC